MHNSHQDEVVVITGASAGVGRAIVREFAAPGRKLALMARGLDGLHAAKREAEEAGAIAEIFPLDVSDARAVEDAAEQIEQTLGPIDIWINNAMVSVFARALDITPEEFKRVTEVTYLGYVYGTLSALRRMAPRNRGTIVLVGSALAYRGIPYQAAYCAAKHAIQGFSESVRCELLHDKINVHITMVQMPGVNTPQFEWIKSRMPRKPRPVGIIFQPEVAARAVYFAAFHDRREMQVGLPTLQSIQANKFAPGYLDRYLAKVIYEGHQTDEPEDPNRPDNLWAPVRGDHGAHGRYDALAKSHSPQLWLSTHRRHLAFAGLGLLAGAGAAALAKWLGSCDGKQQSQTSRRTLEPILTG